MAYAFLLVNILLQSTRLMKILFVISHYNFWAPLEPVAEKYVEKGHEVRVLIDRVRNRKFEDRYPFAVGRQSYELSWSLARGDLWQYVLNPLRELISYISYLRLRTPTSPVLIERWSALLPFFLRPLTRSKLGQNWLSSETFWNLIRNIEAQAPTSRRIQKQLIEFAPDIVVAASAVLPYSKETDYIKAAQNMEIPTVIVVPSWDNLTTKGMLHAVPDYVFVWNKGQISEAKDLHYIPVNKVFCTGAPKFDSWFQIAPSLDRRSFCEKIGIDPEKEYLLYLCSSEFISGDEVIFVKEVAKRLKQDPRTRNINLLVRPHPQNLDPWKHVEGDAGDFFLWPMDQTSLASLDMNQDYFHSLFYSIGTVGINTSAFIEAAIVDKPCIAITSERYANTQMSIPHFHHLLDAGFLVVVSSLDEFNRAVSELSIGNDINKRERREFVRDFVRPYGLNVPAIDVIASAIENVAMRREPDFGIDHMAGVVVE